MSKICYETLRISIGFCFFCSFFFVVFFVFQEKIKFPIFLSQWPFSLFVGKTCLSDRIFPEKFFACSGLINLRVTFGNSFFTQKAVWKTILSSLFQTAFWVKKEFPIVTRKLISLPQAKTFSGEIRSLRQVFPNLVSPPQAKTISGKIWSVRQVFPTKRENGHWDRKIGCLFTKKMER